jgi:hypothetical protein
MPGYIYFDIDAADRIIATSPNWDQAALARGGISALSAQVLGKSFWGFVAGEETRQYYEKLFQAARMAERRVELPYRCDGPMVMRSYHMDIHALPNGHLRIGHTHITAKAEEFSVIQMPGNAIEKVCSICLSVYHGGAWHDDYFAPRGPTADDHFTVCPACQRAAKII